MISRILLSAALSLLALSAICQVPQTLSYQGLLTDNTGALLPDGAHTVLFRFYNGSGTEIANRGPITASTFKGLFAVTIGDGSGVNNAILPFSLGDQEISIGLTIDAGVELTPRIKLTAVPYAFVANTVKSVDAALITSGTLPIARIGDGTVTDIKLATGIDASKITTGTLPAARISDGSIADVKIIGMASSKLTGSVPVTNGGTGGTTAATARTNLGLAIGVNVQAFDNDLDDLASDGLLSASRVDGANLLTVSASNISNGTLALVNGGTGATTAANARINLGLVIGTNVQAFDADLTDLSDGMLTGSKVGSGIDAANITTGFLTINSGSPAPSEGMIRYNSTEKVMEYYNGTSWYFISPKVAFLKDTKLNGVDGQSLPANIWTVRDLQEPAGGDPDNIVSVTSNQFTLPAGEYIIEAHVPCFGASFNQGRLAYGSTYVYGENQYANPSTGSASSSTIFARITIASSTNFTIEHATSSGHAAGGGSQNILPGTGDEVYTQVKITKLR